MKISFAITVCNELDEIKRLLPFLLEHKRIEDEIVILFDEKNGSKEVLDFLLPFNIKPNVQTWRSFEWNDNFADWKNILNNHCSGDFIFQLDADEMLDEYLVKNVVTILEMNQHVDVIFVPRINTVDGLTQEHIKTWNWRIDENNYVNFPDMQGRIYRAKMSWYGKVHEKIIGGQYFSSLPTNPVYCIKHHKTIERQEKQNKFYNSL